MYEFARGEFYLGARQPDGSTLRANLLSVHRQTGVRPKQLEVESCPPLVGYVWDWFLELQEERSFTEMGSPEALTSGQLESWSRLNRISLSAFELKAIKQLDRLFISKKYEKKEEPA